MPKSIKIGVIGAGSATFSLGLVKDICLTASLDGSHVSFMDIDQERLEVVHKLATRYAAELGSRLTFDSTLDREAALDGADFVINTAAVKGHYHARALREMTAKHGYYYGGVSAGPFYQFQLMLDVARDMERICPDAWLIQSGNPVFEGCTLMTRETGIQVCGLCHGHYGVYELAAVTGAAQMDKVWAGEQRITWEAPGFNHNIWLTHFYVDGQDAYPKVDEWIATKGEEYWRTHVATRTHDAQLSRGAVHQYHMYGLFPIGDTVRRGGWWYHTDLATKKRWFGEPWGGPDTELARPVHVEGLEKRLAEMARLIQDPKARVTEVFGSKPTREQQVPIIDGLVNNHEGYFQVNVPNRGALPGIPEDVVVEVPALVNAKGIQPVQVEPLPNKLFLEHILPDWLHMERQLEAFKTGDRSMLLWNVLDSHQTRTYDQALAVLEDIMNFEGHEEMREHFQWPKNWS